MLEIIGVFLLFILYNYLVVYLYNKRSRIIGKVITLLFASLTIVIALGIAALCKMAQVAFENNLYNIYGKAEWCRTVNVFRAVLCNNSTWYIYYGINKTNPSIEHAYTECFDTLLNKTRKIGYLGNYYYLIRLICKYNEKEDVVSCVPDLSYFLK